MACGARGALAKAVIASSAATAAPVRVAKSLSPAHAPPGMTDRRLCGGIGAKSGGDRVEATS